MAAPPEGRKTPPWLPAIVLLAVLILAGSGWMVRHGRAGRAPGMRGGSGAPVPVSAARVTVASVPEWVTALGSVTPRSYVNVVPRVSGLLKAVDYHEGQMVQAGQLLAQIDPRPYEIQVEQVHAQLLRDEALLRGAVRDLRRYQVLLRQNSIAHQQVDDQRALVAQDRGTVAADQAALDNARLQLSYTRITAPISGLAGLRLVDPGNMVGTSGGVGSNAAATGNTSGGVSSNAIVSLAEVQPITVVFAIPQDQLPEVLAEIRAGHKLEVEAWDARNRVRIATGFLLATDNQINVATGTINLRAEFQNRGLRLFPNQFVNVRLLVRTLPDALVVPAPAVAVGAPGTYVYVIGPQQTVAVRTVVAGVTDHGMTVITRGLTAGERVVTDGLDRLRPGAHVRVIVRSPSAAGGAPAAPVPGGTPAPVRTGGKS